MLKVSQSPRSKVSLKEDFSTDFRASFVTLPPAPSSLPPLSFDYFSFQFSTGNSPHSLMDSFTPGSDSQADLPVRLTRSKRLKAHSEGEQVINEVSHFSLSFSQMPLNAIHSLFSVKSQRRPRRDRTPARVFSPERWRKKEKRDEKLTKESSFAVSLSSSCSFDYQLTCCTLM